MIRTERPGSEVVEHRIVDQLRLNNALTHSLVAIRHGDIVGHVALSPTTVSETPGQWYQLGPIGVLPNEQRRGVGTALMQSAIERSRQDGVTVSYWLAIRRTTGGSGLPARRDSPSQMFRTSTCWPCC